MVETEVGMTGARSKEYGQLLEAEKARKYIPPEPPEGIQPCVLQSTDTDFETLTFRIIS
jgi:hypothetical protein